MKPGPDSYRAARRSMLGCLVLSLTLFVPGCATDTAIDARGFGGALRAAAGPEARSALIGSDVGTGVGHVIGDGADRAKAARLDVREHYEVGRLGATRWKVIDIQPNGAMPAFEEMIVYFRPNGRVETTTRFPGGRTETTDESFRVVGDTIIVSGRGYLINAAHRISGQEMTLDGGAYRALLRRLPS